MVQEAEHDAGVVAGMLYDVLDRFQAGEVDRLFGLLGAAWDGSYQAHVHCRPRCLRA